MPKAILCALGVAEWFALAVLVPIWVRKWGAARAVMIAGGVILVSFAVTVAFPAGRLVLGGNLALHVCLLCFAVAITGVCRLGTVLFKREWAGQAAAAVITIALSSSVLIVNPIVEGFPKIKGSVVTVVMATNPATICGAALGYDVMRKAKMYEICAIGSYRFTYPAWYATAGIHLAAGIIFLGLSLLWNGRNSGE